MSRPCHYVVHCAFLFLIVSGVECFASRGSITVIGASQEEQIQLSVDGSGDECLHDRILVLSEVLRDHPRNRGALLARAQAQIELGLIDGAKLDLSMLNSIDPKFPTLDYTEVLLAKATGLERR